LPDRLHLREECYYPPTRVLVRDEGQGLRSGARLT
jgi:hypothetical protein